MTRPKGWRGYQQQLRDADDHITRRQALHVVQRIDFDAWDRRDRARRRFGIAVLLTLVVATSVLIGYLAAGGGL